MYFSLGFASNNLKASVGSIFLTFLSLSEKINLGMSPFFEKINNPLSLVFIFLFAFTLLEILLASRMVSGSYSLKSYIKFS